MRFNFRSTSDEFQMNETIRDIFAEKKTAKLAIKFVGFLLNGSNYQDMNWYNSSIKNCYFTLFLRNEKKIIKTLS